MMHDSTTKNPAQQAQKHKQQLKAAQKKWIEEVEGLFQERVAIGYKDHSWEDFLKVVLDDSIDMISQSKIFDVQERYKYLITQQEMLFAEDTVVDEFNKKHAVVRVDKTYILTEKVNWLGVSDFSLESRQSFKDFYEDEKVMCLDSVEHSKTEIWLKSPQRRKYQGIIFDPTIIGHTADHYNLWKGFARKAQQGDCSKYWEHLRDNICNEDQGLYLYVRKWLALVFQHPDQVHTALVFLGSQGTGKNSFVDSLGVLLGLHYSPLSSTHELVSNFNDHLKNAVIVHVNEASWEGNRKDIGIVKTMITDPYCLIEGKGKDRIVVRNFKHIIISSNEERPVHLDTDDRRFLVIRVSEKHKNDHQYFKALHEQLNNGGYEALLYDLLHEDLSGFDPRVMPASSDSFDIKMQSADSAHRYFYEVLCEGAIAIGDDFREGMPVWQREIPKDTVYEKYVNWCKKSGEDVTTNQLFGRVIKKLLPSVGESRPGGKPRPGRCYVFPSLEKAREEFARAFKESPERIFDEYEVR